MLALLIFATPLDLIWNVSPAPHGDYVACVDSKATVCVQPGEWWGICRAQEFGAAEKSIKAGTLTLKDKQAHFSACPYYQALFAKRIEVKSPAFAGPGCQSGEIGMAPFNGKTIAYKVAGTVQFSTFVGPANCEDKGIVWSAPIAIQWPGPGVPSGKWSIDVVGDLNADGNPELIVSNRTFAMLVSLKDNALQTLATTVTTPKLALSAEEKTVAAAIAAKEMCEHWGGEEGYDAERAKEIANNSKRDCAAFKAMLTKARQAYPLNVQLKAL